MITQFPRHVGQAHPKPVRRRSPRQRMALHGCICIGIIIMSVLALNPADQVTAGNRPETITLAQPLTTPDTSPTRIAAATNVLGETAQLAPDMVTELPASPAVMPDSVPNVAGKLILVSESQQWMWVYDHNKLVGAAAITTGRPQLPTPVGTFHVLSKAANLMFYSPWPRGSPFYYTPEHIFHALYFREGGYYIHDASWREKFGPGSNVPHKNPDGSIETGSHGCVNVTVAASAWLYQWANIGTTIVIRA